MANRRIAVNIRQILDLMQYCKNEEISAMVLNLDYLKAFDRVEFSSVKKSMSYFNYPDYLINWVDVLYNDFKIQIQNTGHLTPEIKVERSVHQGGCASAFLFNLLVEVLAINIRKNCEKHAIQTKTQGHLLTQYADDTESTAKMEQEAIDDILNELTSFQNNTGLQVNYDKTSIYRIGSARNSNAMLYTTKPIAWTRDPFTLLGIRISYENLEDLNFSPMYDKVSAILKRWRE